MAPQVVKVLAFPGEDLSGDRLDRILEAIDEKLGMTRTREQMIRDLAGWLSHEEAEELRKSVAVFDQIHEGDWP